jgi:hypothetical protein
MIMVNQHIFIASLVAIATFSVASTALASSHREAPSIAEDQFADNTDVYTFISPEDPNKLVIVANYVPLLLPASGPNFYRFSDSVRYEICVDNDGDARADVCYRFRFRTTIENGGTFLYNVGPIAAIDDANLNVKQVYDVIRIELGRGGQRDVIARDVPVAPWNVGSRSFPGGSYERIARQGITDLEGGGRVFAGPRDEPFFVDLHVFDLLGVGGAPTTDGVNVMSLVLEVPISDVAARGTRPSSSADGQDSVVGIYARALRRHVSILGRSHGSRGFGNYTQVSRLGWPLVNEVIIPLQDKDHYNRSNPVNDVANFGTYILDPEVPGLLNLVLGAGCPPTPADGRLDIVGLLSPFGTTPADLLRIDIREGQTFAESGFPNGRWLEDDVTDTLLTVACANGSPIGDGVDANDLPFGTTFPYLASPHSGNP